MAERVAEIHEISGDKFVVFISGCSMVLRSDGRKEFTTANGHNLHCSPNSRYYPGLVKMWQAYKAVRSASND